MLGTDVVCFNEHDACNDMRYDVEEIQGTSDSENAPWHISGD